MRAAAATSLLLSAGSASGICPVSGKSSGGGCQGSLRDAVALADREHGPQRLNPNVTRQRRSASALSADDEKQVTVNGCRCKSSDHCRAGASDLYRCDWCYVEGDCGSHGLQGRYDYCFYPPDTAYEVQSADAKMAQLWGSVTADPKRGEYPNLLGILQESVQTTFDNVKDWMPAGRKKYIHSVGTVCKFTMTNAEGTGYTGLFTGTVQGLVRMGSAAALTDNGGNDGITPGLGIKILRSGVESGNYVALNRLDVGQSWNFFYANYSNHIPAPTGATALLAKKFNQASNCAPQVGLSNLATHDSDGKAAAKVDFPFRLIVEPSQQAAASQDPKKPKTLDALNQQMAFPQGTTLFHVYHVKDPESAPALLGDMVTTDACTSSAYGDGDLFIRHQRVEEDWKLHPEWLQSKSYDASKACGHSADPTPPTKCGH